MIVYGISLFFVQLSLVHSQRCPSHLPVPLHDPMRGCKWVLEKDWDNCYHMVTDCSFNGVFNRTDGFNWQTYSGIDRSNVCDNELRCPSCYDCLKNRFENAKCVWNGRCCPRNSWVACAQDPCKNHKRTCTSSEYCIQNNCGLCSAIFFNKDLDELSKCGLPTECVLPLQKGRCHKNIPAYYYDASRARCELFIYSGCGGNDNRFASRAACQNYCKDPNLIRGLSENNGNGRISVGHPDIDKYEPVIFPGPEIESVSGKRSGDCPMQRVYRKCAKDLALDECISDGQCPEGYKCCMSDCGEYTCREAVSVPTDVLPPDPFSFKPVTKPSGSRGLPESSLKPSATPDALALACCKADRRITSNCYQLCSYQITKRTVVQTYVDGKCPIAHAFQPGLMCLAGGRDHEECCRRANVHKVAGGTCMAFCRPTSPFPYRNQQQLMPCLGVIKQVVSCFNQYARRQLSTSTQKRIFQ